MTRASPPALPPRAQPPSLGTFALYFIAVLLLAASFHGAEIAPLDLLRGLPDMARVVGQMVPPDTSRLTPVLAALTETFQMAFAGVAIGVVLSLPLAVMASRRHTPHPIVYAASRGVISLFRTVPDLFWALFFVATVGLGPFAGTITIVVDTIGFCGRFFAEALEEVDEGPQEALAALGARRIGIVAAAVLPGALPSLINTALFSLEKATRASVVLGLVGAGGIGMELKVAMDMFRYDQAATIIIAVFALVLVVETASARLRRKVIAA